jgi:VCBS repeat-containing protein
VLRATVSSGETSGDNTPPMISNISVSNLTCDSVDIIWTTDEESTSQVEYSASPTRITPLDESLVTDHLVRLDNLEPDTTYTYTILSTDASGNLALVSSTFVTPTDEANNSPVAANDTYTVNQDSILDVSAPGVLVNDSDVDGDLLTISMITNVRHGNLTLNANGSFTYQPDAGFAGTDSFAYKANDGTSESNTATVTLTVTGTSNNESLETFGIDDGNRTYYEVSSVLNVIRLRNDAGNGTLTKLEILFNDISPNGKVRLGVYADDNGKPGNLLLDAGEVNVSNGWVSISGLNLPVNEGTYYWLAFNLQDRNGVKYQSNYATDWHYWIVSYYGPLPAQLDISRASSEKSAFVLRAAVLVVE